ncbi:MAG: CTP synthase [Bacilli bacterium]|nr:CTP synthase [Bacilli bacterium]
MGVYENIMLVCGLIISLGGAAAVIVKLISPWKQLRLEIDEIKDKQKKDYERSIEEEETNKMICKCLLVMLDHEITGNSIDKLKSTKSDLQDFLINK